MLPMKVEDLKIVQAPLLVREQALDRLRSAIITGLYKPGTRLIERELCEALGVSRTSVREVLRQLEAERLIDMGRRRGPVVAAITPREAREIYELREILEGVAVRRFTERATDTDVQKLRRCYTEFSEAATRQDMPALIQSMAEFYDVLYTGAGNAVIHEVSRQLLARVSYLRATSMSEPGRLEHSVREIGGMVAAVEARQPEAAEKATVEHVRLAAEAAMLKLRDMQAEAEPVA